MKSIFAFNNQIYDLPADMICVIVWYWHHLDDKYWREESIIDSKHIRNVLFLQNGICSEQNVLRDSICYKYSKEIEGKKNKI